jgi:DNA-binding protein VF530
LLYAASGYYFFKNRAKNQVLTMPTTTPPATPPAPPAQPATQPKNPLHGQTLEAIVTTLAAHYGWAGLGERIPVRCFMQDPSVASALKFLRKTHPSTLIGLDHSTQFAPPFAAVRSSVTGTICRKPHSRK